MASRGRVALIALGAGAGVLVLFVFTVWLILTVSDDGLPGGAKVAVVEVEGVIGVGTDRGLDTESIIRTLGEYRDDPAVRAVVLRIDSPGGVVAPTQEIFTTRTSTQIAQTAGICIGQVTHAIARHFSLSGASSEELQELQELRERETILNEVVGLH